MQSPPYEAAAAAADSTVSKIRISPTPAASAAVIVVVARKTSNTATARSPMRSARNSAGVRMTFNRRNDSFRRVDAQFLDLLIQRIAIDPQKISRFGLHSAALVQRPVDQSVLDLLDNKLINFPFAQLVVDDSLIRQSTRKALDRFTGLIRPSLRREHPHAQRQQLLSEILIITQHDRSLDGIFQLAHIPRPRISQQHIEHIPADSPQAPIVHRIVFVQEV